MFKRVGIFGKYNGIESWEHIDKLVRHLVARNKYVLLDSASCRDFPCDRYGIETMDRGQLAEHIDVAIVVGGDGTFLDVARSIVDEEIPILGINLGRLGFLTDISPSEMLTTIDEVMNGIYESEHRNLIHVTIEKNGQIEFDQLAFNDVVIHKTESPRMIEFETMVDGRLLNSQRSDGMIIATPTGSTAYALSAGGPILDPRLDVLSLVSINPHTMSTRPYVIPGSSTVEIRPHKNCNGSAHIICDGQLTHHIDTEHHTTVTRHTKFIKMIHPKGHDHFELLRAKLRWGDKF
ncbi:MULTISPECIES: NAD(+) kinase [Thiomicrorhabdus]|uniref:NAD kinase n=1 Tax=Thiomicrorhabdus heinhorstiae TaxID=2748010 RepID=A0ABS0BVR3_9GAMM|nr:MULTISPECIES: NAD(+) kinase [Thiomicrorhabdus]MBF6057889.1 NAD(+) kinase [Thiomicrorhabdus heinhorstiae]